MCSKQFDLFKVYVLSNDLPAIVAIDFGWDAFEILFFLSFWLLHVAALVRNMSLRHTALAHFKI